MEPEIQKLDDEFANKIIRFILENTEGLRLSENPMRIVITGGPSSEPIDQVRVITNRSTGELAVELARKFAAAGHSVELFLGQGAICRWESATYFQTNEDLLQLLVGLTARHQVTAVLHAAALSDFGVEKVTLPAAQPAAAKISSTEEFIQLQLVAKPKLIPQLRGLFVNAYIIGWKFELDGTPADVVREGIRQIQENRTDACIVNGKAFGSGFGFCTEQGLVHTLPTKRALADWLVDVVRQRTSVNNSEQQRTAANVSERQ